MIVTEITNKLQKLANPAQLAGMSKFGMEVEQRLGVSVPDMRKLAKEIKLINDKTARWIAADALRELTSEKILNKLPN